MNGDGAEKSPSPFFFSNVVYKWLDSALDYGISEYDFWNFTLAELTRLIESKKRTQKREARDKANFDYVLADMVGRSISRLYSSSAHMPSIEEVYPSLFDSQEIQEAKQQKKDELSALRFKQFVNSHNKKFQKEGNKQ